MSSAASRERNTPMMKQYQATRASLPEGTILLYRLGDFYEVFEQDAKIISQTLNLVLTHRNQVPMCGFPHHALDNYLPRILSWNYKVAIAEQMEDPKDAKGLVKREVIQIITPGTVLDGDSGAYNYLASLFFTKNREQAVLAALDVSVGEFFYTKYENPEQLLNELERLRVREVIIPEFQSDAWHGLSDKHGIVKLRRLWTSVDRSYFDPVSGNKLLLEQFKVTTLSGFGCQDCPESIGCAAALLRYAADNLKAKTEYISDLRLLSFDHYLGLDPATVRNLDLLETSSEDKRATLFGILNKTCTAMGQRRLKQYILRPLLDIGEIRKRLQTVQKLVDDPYRLEVIRKVLNKTPDVERILARINLGKASIRDILQISECFVSMKGIEDYLIGLPCFPFPEIKKLRKMEVFGRLTLESFREEPGAIGSGEVFVPGYWGPLDDLVEIASNSKNLLADMQNREIERTGIRSLKIKYSSVTGYFIEVTKANLKDVPGNYQRKQTLVSSERFITEELKELEDQLLGAEERIRRMEQTLFTDLCNGFIAFNKEIRDIGSIVGELDVLCSLAEVSRLNNYTCPEICDDDVIEFEDGRHPVLEKLMAPGEFVANSLYLDRSEQQLIVLTGPNMGGKSTYIRQAALIVIMAQIGCLVPAKRARIGVVDRIFTRIGAADDLAGNQSTFMVEMAETSYILRNATVRSLVIMDEVGRGTSTCDGLAIAWSVVDYLYQVCQSRTLFATHYLELTSLEKDFPGIKNYCVQVHDSGGEIVFLHQIERGAASRSYALFVAKLSGMPPEILLQAEKLLGKMESRKQRKQRQTEKALTEADSETGDLFPAPEVIQPRKERPKQEDQFKVEPDKYADPHMRIYLE